jgi:hypothetical protein
MSRHTAAAVYKCCNARLKARLRRCAAVLTLQVEGFKPGAFKLWVQLVPPHHVRCMPITRRSSPTCSHIICMESLL